KAFADAIPEGKPEEINLLYTHINRSDRNEVSEFVHKWFKLPEENVSEIKLESLPIDQHLSALWDHLMKEPHKPFQPSSLIPLPYPYVVPGGRFREIYYWDSYITMLGLRLSGRMDMIREMIKNFAWQSEQFGHIPNGNRS